MSAPLRRRLAALEACLEKRGQERRRRHVWWHAERGEPEPVAEPGEELHVYHWTLPAEEGTSEAVGAGGETAPPDGWRRGGERWPAR